MTELLDELRANKEREKRIRELKEKDPRLNENEIVELLNRMRKSYRSLIVQHPEFVYGNNQTETSLNENDSTFFFRSNEKDQYDIAGQLWKSCFYKQISEFRSSLKRHTMHLDNLMRCASIPSAHIREPTRHLDETQAAAERHERLYIARLTQAFLSFLSDSIAFYQKLMSELEDRARGEADNAVALRRCVTSMHKCLLYLGDLARYREMYQDKEGKDFAEAQRYYERAALIDPGSGNAQNQLAVLATYCEAECVSVYHYCRSILATSPFAGSFENLSLLLSKNAAAFAQLRPPLPAASRSKRQISAYTGVLLVRFVHLHGQLFSRSTVMHHSYSELLQRSQSQGGVFSGSHSSSQHWLPQLSQAVTQSSSAHGEIDQEKFSAELRLVLDEFDLQLAAGNLPDVLLVRLLAISLFSVHYAVGRDASLLAWGEEVCSAEGMRRYLRAHSEHDHSAAESLALQALYGLVNRAATRIGEMMSNNDRGCRSTMNKTLPMLSVFASWAQLHANYMHQTGQLVVTNTGMGNNKSTDADSSARHLQQKEDIAPPSMFQDSPPGSMRSAAPVPGSQSSQDWESTFLAVPELLRAEVRARAGVRASMASLRAVLEADVRSNEHFGTAGAPSSAGEECPQYLREHIELRGFLPLVSLIEEGAFSHFNPLSRSLSVMSEPLARYHRQCSVLTFIADAAATTGAATGGTPTTGLAGSSTFPAAKASPSGKMRPNRKRDDERTGVSAAALPTAAVRRGPPAIASEDRTYVAPSLRQEERAIPPSMQDFPALPSNFSRGSLIEPTATETDAWDGTGTAREEDEEELDDTVVFKSAFVRTPQHTSSNSLAADTGVSGAASGHQQLNFDVLPDFLRSPLASPQQQQEQQLFQDLLQGGAGDSSYWSSAEIGAPASSPWGYPTTTSTTALSRETIEEAPHFNVFSYLDPELPSSSMHSTGSTLQSPFFSSLGGPGAFGGAFPPFYGQQQQSQRPSSIVLGDSGQQVPVTTAPPGLSSLRDSSNSTPAVMGAGSAHSSSNSLLLHRPASSSRLSAGAAPPPGLG